MSEQTIPIPGRLKNVAIGGHVTGSEDIDAGGGKTQKQVNDETNDTLALHQSEISGLNSQNYVSVSSYSSLPATGSADTIYRVSSWDGNANNGAGAVDVTKYTEYAWNGTTYIVVSVKTQIGEVFDISEYKAIGGTLATFDDLSAALDNGNNVPAGIRKGGMSVKFVQSSDNKYVQYRYMRNSTVTATFTNVYNWQGVDDEPTAESENLVKSGGVYEKVSQIDQKCGDTLTFSEKVTGMNMINNYQMKCLYQISVESVNPVPTQNNNYRCVVVSCNQGDEFIVTGKTDNNGRLYAFTDNEYNVLDRTGMNQDVVDKKIIAPENAVYLFVNSLIAFQNYLYKGETFDEKLTKSLTQNITEQFFDNGSARALIADGGKITGAGTWRYKAYNVEHIKVLKNILAHAGALTSYCLVFYSSTSRLDDTTFVSGVQFDFINDDFRIDTVIVPSTAKTVVLFNQNTAGAEINIEAIFKDIDVYEQKYLEQLSNKTYRKSKMKFGAHQGYRAFAPANTVPAYELAGLNGWDYLWLAQVRHSADGTWYIMHNATIDETTDGTGTIEQLTDAYLASVHIDIGPDNNQYTEDELKIPTLIEAIQICNLYSMGACYRLNDLPASYETVEQKALWDDIIDIIRSYSRESDIFAFESGSQINLMRTITNESWEGCLYLGTGIGADGIISEFQNSGLTENLSCLIHVSDITESDVKKLHKNKIKVYVWTGTDISQSNLINYAKWGVDIFVNGFSGVIDHIGLNKHVQD